MLNHFRTLLLNESYVAGNDPHIAENYVKKTLPEELLKIYNILFPVPAVNFRQFLAHCYIGAIVASGNKKFLSLFDNRLSYSVDSQTFFSVPRWSNPNQSNGHKLEILSGLRAEINSPYVSDIFTIKQINNSEVITIHSKEKNKNIQVDGSEYELPTDPAGFITLELDPNYPANTHYKPVSIGHTGVVIRIIVSAPLTNTSNNSWQFLVTTPYVFDPHQIVGSLESISAFKLLETFTSVEIALYKNVWLNSRNVIEKLAALLMAYVTVLNKL